MAELLIVFREVLEAALIIGILYTYFEKNNNTKALKQLWRGVYAALVASVLGSIIFQSFAGGFSGQAEKLFEGIVMIIASVILASMIIWMVKNQNIAEELKEKAKESTSSEKFGYGVFALAFISVFREGIETILFLYGVMIKQGNISIIFSLIGAFLGLGIGYAIFIKGRSMPLKSFFNISSILLIFVASGMFAYGIHELESAGVITDYGRIWNINPELNADGTYPILHDKGLIGSLLKGLLGYNGDPSLIEFMSWLLSLSGFFYLYYKNKTKVPKLINEKQ